MNVLGRAFKVSSARPSIESPPKSSSLDLTTFQTLHAEGVKCAVPLQVDTDNLPILNEKEFRQLCHQDKGTLFENAVVKMGAHVQFTGSEGKCLIYIGNGSQETLEGVAIQVIPVAGVKILQESKAPTQVQPGQKAAFTLQITVREPFTGCPRLLVMYLYRRTPYYLHLKLPIVLASALQPPHSEATETYRTWQSLIGTETVVHFSALHAGINSMGSLASALRFHSNLQLCGAKDLPELEKGAVLGVGCLGEEVVSAMVTVEGNAKSGKIAVRARSMRLRDAMLALLKEFIGG